MLGIKITRKTKTVMQLFFALALTVTLVFAIVAGFYAHAANYNEAQSGITIHGNYDITTANSGAYASKSVVPSNFSSGSYYTTLYAGGTVDVTNGYMYEAAASGITSTVRLFDEYSGTFSIFGQGFYDANSSPFDYGKLSFIFTNTANTKQYIKFSFTQSASNYLAFNAYYYDLDVQETAVYKTASDMNLMASFTATSNYMTNKNKTALKFSYNNSTQALDLRNSSSVGSHNLNTLLGTTLTAFSSYSVDMSFENKDEEHTAKFIIYELCGKLLDIGVHDNYDITTANDGAYASKSVDPSKFSATSYYTELYSGDRLDVTKGRLYMAGKKNTTSTIRLFDEHSGTFSIVGQGFYDESSSPFDYTRLTFTFTNTANTNQYIKFVFIQNASNYLEFNAYYYDKGIQDSAINRMSSNMALMASFTATSNYMTNKNKTALKFSYNNSTQALDLRNSGSAGSHNLNTLLGTTLTAFSSYSVDMAFEYKHQTTTAKFIAYELCGVNFSEAKTMTVKDMAGETVSESTVFKGQTVTIPTDNAAGFVGYMIDGEIYPAGYKYTVSTNFEMQKMVISPTMMSGAYIRLTIDETYHGGIRFGIKVNDEDMEAFGENIEMHGVLIYTEDIEGDFDLDEANSVDKALNNYCTDGDDRMYFITLTNIKSGHYNTSYSARAYLKITMYNDSYVIIATDYSAENHARSPYNVALKALDAGYSGAVIDEYLNKKIIARNGSAYYSILIPDDHDEAIEFAATEMSYFINEITDVNVDIIEETDYNGSDKVISIGETELSSDIVADADALNNDGFILKTVGDNIFIKGAYPRATIYGVYDFIERMMGVKFIAEDYTYVPKAQEVYSYSLDITEVPAFATRSYFAQNVMYNGLYAVRMRMVAPFDTNLPQYGGGFLSEWNTNQMHSMFELLPPSVYYEDHPEWYTMSSATDKGQVCFTNGVTDDGKIDNTMETSVIKETISNIKAILLANENIKYVMVGQQDNADFCECENCLASYDRFNGLKSGTVMVFVNLIAEEIEKWAKEELGGREVNIVTFAYQATEEPPVVVDGEYVEAISEQVVPRDNVYVLMAISNACFYHPIYDEGCTRNATTRTLINNWNVLTNRLMIWDYQTNFDYHQWYFDNKNAIKDNLIEYRDMGVEMLICQAAPRESKHYLADLDNYIFSKLMWNPERYTIDELVKEFNFYYYGEYHDVADEFYQMMEDHFADLDTNLDHAFHTELRDGNSAFFNYENYPIEFLEEAEGLIQDAIDAIQDDENLTEDEKLEMTFRLTKIIVIPQMMILKNYDSYYESGKKDFAREVISNLEYVGAKYYAENMKRTIFELKIKYGLTEEIFVNGDTLFSDSEIPV